MLRPADLKDDDLWKMFRASRAGDLNRIRGVQTFYRKIASVGFIGQLIPKNPRVEAVKTLTRRYWFWTISPHSKTTQWRTSPSVYLSGNRIQECYALIFEKKLS
jgi:hypothetical protein